MAKKMDYVRRGGGSTQGAIREAPNTKSELEKITAFSHYLLIAPKTTKI